MTDTSIPSIPEIQIPIEPVSPESAIPESTPAVTDPEVARTMRILKRVTKTLTWTADRLQQPQPHVLHLHGVDDRGGRVPYATIAIEANHQAEQIFFCGMAILSPGDQFSRKVGRHKALGRLERVRSAPSHTILPATSGYVFRDRVAKVLFDLLNAPPRTPKEIARASRRLLTLTIRPEVSELRFEFMQIPNF